MNDNITKGKIGESIAKRYLINKGYKILETNYKNRIGEIDIIATYSECLIFVEVKTRTSTSYGYAFEAVSYHKQKKIINVSMAYVKYKGLLNKQLRYDIIEVYFTNNMIINHMEDAFCL